jgi:hypothetical protein
MHAAERSVERRFVQAIALNNLGLPCRGPDSRRIADETPDGVTAFFEMSKKAATYVTRRSSNQDCLVHARRYSSLGRRTVSMT